MSAHNILTSSKKFHIKLGLDRIKKVLELLGNPQKNLKCIHIAGTNGKGSVCAILESILLHSGFRVAKFTSPHLFSYTERITINRVSVSDDYLDFLVEKINKLAESYAVELTEFEILTAAAFYYFNENDIDYVILETGLGGRLDSTNIIEKPLVSVITSISLDHTQRLGDSIEKIAFEKAGIIKKDVPCVFLKENKGEKVLFETARKVSAPVINPCFDIKIKSMYDKCGDFTGSYAFIDNDEYKFSLNGSFQKENLALALAALSLLPVKLTNDILSSALSDIQWKFRMDVIKYGKTHTNILVDSCHNPGGALVLSDFLRENYEGKKIKFLYGTLNNKDYISIINTLFPFASGGFYFYSFDYPNSLKFSELPSIYSAKMTETINPLSEINKNDCDLTVVCGSIYMLGKLFAPSN